MSEYTKRTQFDQCYYLTFPIAILKHTMTNIRETMDHVMCYCLFEKGRNYRPLAKRELMKLGADELKITFGNIGQAYDRGEAIWNSVPSKSPKVSITKKMVFDFYDNHKTEFEIVTFLAFAALKSIIQQQAYIKVTNDYLLGRMAGNAKRGELMPEWIKKYSSRYQLDKVKKELQLSWGLKLYSYHVRGFYVSFKLDLETLIYYAESKRKKFKEKQLAQQKKEAKEMAMARLVSDCKLTAMTSTPVPN